MTELVATLVAGIAQGMPLFIVASGLTLIFGVMNVLNFAHGAFFMLGALLLVTILGGQPVSLPLFVGGAVLAGLAVGALGGAVEAGVFRRLASRDHVVTLLASYGLLLALEGAAAVIWGVNPRSQGQSSTLAGSAEAIGVRVPTYDLFLIVVGALIAVLLWFLSRRTAFGWRMRAVAHDATMARALGIAAGRVRFAVFVLGSGLAGVAGALMAPLVSVDPGLAPTFILQSFAVVIVGGLGSVPGALVAAVLLGLADSFAVSYVPVLAGFSLYLAVGLMLLLRPGGLLGPTARTTGVA